MQRRFVWILVLWCTASLPCSGAVCAQEWGFEGSPSDVEWRAGVEANSGMECAWDRSVGRRAPGSLRIAVPDDVPKIGWPHWRHVVTDVHPLETWRVVVSVRTANVRDGHGAYLGLACPAPGTTGGDEKDRLAQSDSAPVIGTAGWKQISEKIVVPAKAAQINVLVLLHGRGTAWFDDITIERVSGPPEPVPDEITASLRTEEVITQKLWGFGFEDDPFFYNDENGEKGVDDDAVALHDARIKALRPGWVRSFVWWAVVNPSRDLETVDLSSDNGRSLLRTLKTYQELDVPVVLTGVEWGWKPEEMPFHPKNASKGARFFAKLVRQLRDRHGLSCVKYLTITNEPDLYWEKRIGPFQTFADAHKLLADAVRDEGLADDVNIVGADVTVMQEFFDNAVAQTSPYCAAWSRHKYLKESQSVFFREVVDTTVASARENAGGGRALPVLFAEFGFHWPGTTDRNHTGVRRYEYGLLTAMAACDMLDGGAAGGAIWCLCRQMYPGYNFMDYGLWNYADESWSVRPVALAYGMFTRFVRPGDDSVKLALEPVHPSLRAAAVARNGEAVALFLVNLSDSEVRAGLAGIPAGSSWHRFEYRPDIPLKSKDIDLLPTDTVDNLTSVILPPKSFIALVAAIRVDHFRSTSDGDR